MSPKQSWKSVERNYDDVSKRSSPEKDIFVIPKIIRQRKKNKSKSRRKRIKLNKTTQKILQSPEGRETSKLEPPNLLKLIDQQSTTSPTKTINTYIDSKGFMTMK